MPSQSGPPLPPGYQLLDYRVARKIGGGGFSIVYLAYDVLDKPVAIKEYLPGGLVTRDPDGVVRPVSEDKSPTFRFGMKCFFEEGRALADITHPNVVRVVNFFRANETVYMVMQYVRGRTLQYHIQARKEPVREGFIRRVFAAMLNGLREVHAHKILHLDIKPSNIYIRLDGSPVLIDFGAARQMQGSNWWTTASPMYTPGFAAPEQYVNREQLGPWTDIYSVGASIYSCLAGAAPTAADQRLRGDKLTPARKVWAGQYSDQLLGVVDWCLKLNYMERPQSVYALQKMLLEKGEPAKRSLFSALRSTLMRETL
jgi:serine/threonine protein kinase